MTRLFKRRLLAAKIETTVGTAVTLAGADAAFNAYNVVFSQSTNVEEREGQGGFGRAPSVVGGAMGTISFSHDLAWDGTSTLPSWATTFLPACGLVAASGVYTPRTEVPGTNVKTLTMGLYNDGLLWTLSGASGTFQMVFPTGRVPQINFTFTGKWESTTDATMLTPTYPSTRGLKYAGATTEWGEIALCLSSLTLDVGNSIVMAECAAHASGYSHAIISDRRPVVTGDPETKLVAQDDRYNDFLAMVEDVLEWSIPAPDGGSIDFKLPKAQINNINPGNRNNITTDDIEWVANRNGSTLDQEFSISFEEGA